MKSIQFDANAHSLATFAINAVRAGRKEEANKAISRLLKLQPGFRTSHVSEAFPVRWPERRADMPPRCAMRGCRIRAGRRCGSRPSGGP
jgi:adenylate cyclase